MELQDVRPARGSKQGPKRVGRGHGSGWGKTSGRGHKGQKARSGGGVRIGFEGGQMPIQRRVPKRGFNNIFARKVVTVNIGWLDEVFGSGEIVTPLEMVEYGFVKTRCDKIKVIATGELTKNLTVKANAFSKGAIEKIESVGGKVEVI